MTSETAPTTELDVTGLKCPLPVLKAQKILRGLAPGAELVVLATDPVSVIDIPHFCNESGHKLVESDTNGAILRFRIRKASKA